MCAIIGIVSQTKISHLLYEGLSVMQHRGQDAAGIATLDDHKLYQHKNMGLVRHVFAEQHLIELKGNVGIGHCRYPTAGSKGFSETQPLYVNAPFGIALAHNGNLTNTNALREALFIQDRRHINTESDSEILLNVFASALQHSTTQINAESIFQAVQQVHQRCIGGYAVVSLILGLGLVAFRDQHGIRPLILGEKKIGQHSEYMIASESVALDALGFQHVRDVAPGECIIITHDGQLLTQTHTSAKPHAPCIFEYVYLARPDSIIERVLVYHARMKMGQRLAQKIRRLNPQHTIDCIIPIPDTARTVAVEMAHTLGIAYREGFVKNRYIDRTFIMPEQQLRTESVRRKLNAIASEFQNKVVLLVDDSIVRGTTSKQIIQMARDAGAHKVYFASAAPPVRFPNVYGIDMPNAHELIAHQRTEEEVQAQLGCDWLVYQDLGDLENAVRDCNPSLAQFDTSCFSGHYVTGIDNNFL